MVGRSQFDFWFTGCKPCIEEMPQIKQLYRQYHEAGFDVVGISSDSNKDKLVAYLAEAAIPWTTIHEGPEIADSNHHRYNIRAWPTAVLVNREGKVVSLEARGDELKKLLSTLLVDSNSR